MSDLLSTISKPEGEHIVLIVDAGCSKGSLMNLSLSREIALDTYHKLIDGQLLNSKDCTDPENLSCVAYAVWDNLKSQKEIVARFFNAKLSQVKPNNGHFISIIMLPDALSVVLTQNFNLALINANVDAKFK